MERQPLYESDSYKALQRCLGANLRRLREARGWTQQEAADRCGEMSQQQYQRVESGSVNVTFTTLARLVDGFEVDAGELLARP